MLWADKSPQLFSKIFIFCIFTAFKAVINRILHIAKMKEEGKSYYEAPAITVVEVKIEGVVCHSPVNGGNSIDNWGNGGTTNDDIYM